MFAHKPFKQVINNIRQPGTVPQSPLAKMVAKKAKMKMPSQMVGQSPPTSQGY